MQRPEVAAEVGRRAYGAEGRAERHSSVTRRTALDDAALRGCGTSQSAQRLDRTRRSSTSRPRPLSCRPSSRTVGLTAARATTCLLSSSTTTQPPLRSPHERRDAGHDDRLRYLPTGSTPIVREMENTVSSVQAARRFLNMGRDFSCGLVTGETVGCWPGPRACPFMSEAWTSSPSR